MKKKTLSLILIILSIFMINSVSAKEIVEAGDNITVEGDYSSLRVIAGDKVDNKSTNDGLSIMAATNLMLQGKSSYGIYAGQNITVKEIIDNDLIIAGSKIIFEEGSDIKRDLYIAGDEVILNTNVGRNVYAKASKIDLSNANIKGDVKISASEIIVNENTVIEGTLKYNIDANMPNISKATIGNITSYNVDVTKIEYRPSILLELVVFVAIYILLIVLLLVMPSFKKKIDNDEVSAINIFKNMGIGFILLIMVPIVSILSMITIVLIPLSILTFVIYFISLFLAHLFATYSLGNIITTKIFNKDNMYLSAFVGLLIVKIVSFIPSLGGIIWLLMFLYGMGLYIKLFKRD